MDESTSVGDSAPCLHLSGDQLKSFDLDTATLGGTVTAQVTFRVSDGGDGGKTLEVVSVDDVAPGSGDPEGSEDVGDMTDDSPNTVPTPEDVPQDIVPPGQAGLEDTPAGDEADTTEKMLGYKRPKKKEGFPVNLATMRSQFR